MLRLRLITGPLLILLLLGIVALDEWMGVREVGPRGVVIFGVALLVALLAAVEFSRIIRASGIASQTWLTASAAVLGLVSMYWTAGTLLEEHWWSMPADELIFHVVWYDSPTPYLATFATAFAIIFILSLITFSRRQNVQGVLAASGAVMLSMLYLGVMIGFFLLIRAEHSAWWIAGIVLTAKSADIGAYFTGTAIGKHKLIPWLSPGKTWEGFIGGVVLAALVGMGMAAMSGWGASGVEGAIAGSQRLPIWFGLLAGAILGLAGQIGDLIMSLFKRGANVKDSANLLPGMGGVLDVIDSLILVAPVAYWLLVVGVR